MKYEQRGTHLLSGNITSRFYSLCAITVADHVLSRYAIR